MWRPVCLPLSCVKLERFFVGGAVFQITNFAASISRSTSDAGRSEVDDFREKMALEYFRKDYAHSSSYHPVHGSLLAPLPPALPTTEFGDYSTGDGSKSHVKQGD